LYSSLKTFFLPGIFFVDISLKPEYDIDMMNRNNNENANSLGGNMNKETSNTRQIPTLDTADFANFTPADRLMYELADNYMRRTDELKSNLQMAVKHIERAQEDLDSGLTLNGCGILQSTGTEIDKLVARRQDAINALMKAAYNLGYETPQASLFSK